MKFRLTHIVKSAAVLCAATLFVSVTQLSATADTAPPDPSDPKTPVTVAADPLPTVQIDGVAWTQRVIGNTVYVGGRFTTARPAGAAPGVNTTTRSNLLAYDIRNGVLINTWAPTTNGDVLSIVPSPDNSTLYIGGSFTNVNGQIRNRIAALNPTTGALVTTFQPKPDATVRAIAVSSDTVYFGGLLSSVTTSAGSAARTRVAAVRASDGSLLPWAPNAQGGSVHSVALSPTGDKVIIGGSFTTMNGSNSPGYGLAAVSPASVNDGTVNLPFPANLKVRNAGANSAITGLSSDADSLYASGYVFGVGGNLEGIARINWSDLSVNWIEDCHGDTYGTFPKGNVIYASSHAHYCGNLPEGFPQTEPSSAWIRHYGTAFTKAATGVLTADTLNYPNWQGNPSPSLLKWFPLLLNGTFTGQGQAGWNVTGNDNYVTIGGEFPTAGGIPQQGLVRYAIGSVAPNDQGPVFDQSKFNPTLTSYANGTVRVAWQANWDRDNEQLTYQVIRDGDIANPVYETTWLSSEWNRPDMGFLDTGLVPGTTYRYRVFAHDAWGNEVRSDTVSVVASGTGAISPSVGRVLNDGASNFWRLGEASGTNVADYAGVTNATAQSGVTRRASGAISGDPDLASTFSGTSTGYASSNQIRSGPNTFTAEAWFKTTTTQGGKILGFGTAATGNSSKYDRQVYMNNAGQLYFGVNQNGVQTVNTNKAGGYRDGQWHHIAASLGASGMRLYVDGALVGTRADVIKGQSYEGVWRIGGDNNASWPSRSTSDYFAGTIDEVAVYPRVLSATQVANHYNGATAGNSLPTAAFSFDASGSPVTFNGSGSSDTDGTIASYAWTLGDGGTATGAMPSHSYAVAGDHQVTLTVTDNDGGTGSITKTVTSVAPTGPFATDDFGRTNSVGWGSADVGGSWTNTSPANSFSVGNGVGRIAMPTPGAGPRVSLNAVNSVDTDLNVKVSLDKLPTPSAAVVYVSAGARTISTNDYRAKLKVASNGGLTLYLNRVVANAETTLTSVVLPTSANYTVGSSLQLRVQATGTSPTTVQAKVWRTGTTEPAAWQLTATDSTSGLQAPGGVGIVTYLSGTVTNQPITLSLDDLVAKPTQ